MKWTDDADEAVKRVPFFVRKRVRRRVEQEAEAAGKPRVTLADVKASQARYLNKMDAEVAGYQVDACFGGSGCPRRTVASDDLVTRIEAVMAAAGLRDFLQSRVAGQLKFHHEFRISIADCPNACSQPQIKDVGILGAAAPMVTDMACTVCGACTDACKEDAIVLTAEEATGIDRERCVDCGACVAACPTGTLETRAQGYRVLIGGKLGRHPRLATELSGIYDADTVVRMIEAFLGFYKSHSTYGQRFAQLLTDEDIDRFCKKWTDASLV